MLYADIHHWLGWPNPEQAFEPDGAGAKVYAKFAQKKIQGVLEQRHPGLKAKVGIIAADPNSDSSEAPLALVCEFPRAARDEELDLAHRLAWNFSRTALLITLEPHRLIAWTCHQDPSQKDKRRICELPIPDGFRPDESSLQREVRDLLHWVNLITQRAQQLHPKQFPPDGRADALLLKNLRYVRGELLNMGLAREFCHDLLARVLFTQFLFDRKDSDGHAFFSPRMMQRLHDDGVLSKVHADLASVLSHKTDTYALFSWMDDRFNGDLFPGKDGEDDDAREVAWRAERNAVGKEHLGLLASLIRGDLDAADKQLKLWKHYSFDTIPLEFISSVYEEFLTADEKQNDKAYYTPSHLVDYVLDAVLPWNDENWNVRILDPCCGSAIFLVKAFQRLIHRWRLANKRDPLVRDLRPILENNLVGVDKNPEAVRVACFSLYLAMADAIEPKHYITRDNVKVFPRLRGTRLIHADFFDEEIGGIRTKENAAPFDLVLGNAPWGDGSIRIDRLSGESRADYNKRLASLPPTKAQAWAKAHNWPVANNDIGPLFLVKAAALVKSDGKVAMVDTASLLYWRDGKASDLRRKLFTTFTFDEITNLSALRREMFTEAIGPACVAVFGKQKPQPQTALHYFTPKPVRAFKPQRGKPPVAQGFTIEPQDVNVLTHEEAAEDGMVWPAFALGGNRDIQLIRQLRSLPNLAKLIKSGAVQGRMGIIPGNEEKEITEFRKRRYFGAPQFPADVFLELDMESVPVREKICVDRGHGVHDHRPFKTPQLLIKQSFSTKAGRFRAVLVKSEDSEWGVIPKETYFSVRDLNADTAHIRSACLVYNSLLATYFLALTSSRIGHYITETLSEELVTVPLPPHAPDISTLDSFETIDATTRKLFGLTPADWNLIEDFLNYTLPDALRKTPGPGRFPTQRKANDGTKEPELIDFAKIFARVVKGTFGGEKSVTATIFSEPDGAKLPVRMVTIHLDAPDHEAVSVQTIATDGLLDQLARFYTDQLKKKTRDATGGGLGFQRVAYFFHPRREDGRRVMNLTIVKPDERRYWTRSAAMRDADQLAGAIAKAAGRKQQTGA